MSTIHNPVNFNPSNYEIIDYYDNRRPEYCGGPIEAYRAEIEYWKQEMEAAFGADWIKKVHHCTHCGNGNVRWIACVQYTPTGERVIFGSSCVNRLAFRDKKEFDLARIKAAADARAVRLAAYSKRQAFVSQNPGLQEIVDAYENNTLPGNDFIRDVVSKLNQYGNLSERQVSALLKAWDREKNPPPAVVRGPAPTGRVTVVGKVLTVKLVDGYFGQQSKMLVELENFSKVWVTVPSALAGDLKGRQIKLTATFTVSKDDQSFAFGKRPKAEILEPMVQ